MDRSDDFLYLCKKYDKNASFVGKDIKCKDEFLIKSSEIYTKLVSNCDYIDNNTLKDYGLFFRSSKYAKEKKARIKNKDNLLYSVNRISEEIKSLKPKEEIHKCAFNCLTNLLNIYIDIINKYEHNLSSYQAKLNKYTNFYFYDVKNVKCNFDYLNTLNNRIYSSTTFDSNLTWNVDISFSPVGGFSNMKKTNYENRAVSKNEGKHLNGNKKSASSVIYLEENKKTPNSANSFENRKEPSNTDISLDCDEENAGNSNYALTENSKIGILRSVDTEKSAHLRKRKDRKVTFDTYNFLDEEEEEEKKKREYVHGNALPHDSYVLNNNQKLEFKKYVDLFEKEENTYIMETKNKIAKISNLMNIFVNKIYEQNENLRMIEHIVEESIENVSQGNTYLSKIQNRKSINSLIFFVLLCTSIFLFIFDFFR
ncbi:syntaxin, Qa-SNARE family, putative [Plasmodium ovale]|uniref:Syntaxin, Qa-SNARE family, putative n=1 Tax=Plasmodium ovale TaxID=36330 RepID=A0A1D3TKK1_PLAOA|nr:syntaxin, Qa-SNARE family, putative [Plasmodium ovale]